LYIQDTIVETKMKNKSEGMINRFTLAGTVVSFFLIFSFGAYCGDSATAKEKPASDKPVATKSAVTSATHDTVAAKQPVQPTATAAKGASAQDTLVVIARLIEIPGKLPPNDLYNYVYIMKYRITKVLKGSYKGQEILVGHYNPLIPRKLIKDKMAAFVGGDVAKFETGAKHRLTLIKPIERIWKDAVEDDYADSDLEKYYALRADNIQ
jgi:hypothetical protein